MNIDLRLGDCLEVLKTIPDNSIDSIVTDPPYGIGFMNKEWDNPQKHQELIEREKERSVKRFEEGKSPAKAGFSTGVQPGLPIGGAKEGKWFQDWCELWARECFRILKPGGHALSFSAPRTYHRMATAFEDSGFQIRDQIMWVFASGFPKSHNISKSLIKLADEKERTEQNIQHNLRCMPNSDIQETKSIVEEQSEMLLGRLSEQDLSSSEYPTNNVWGQEPILEGGNNLQETEGQLQGSKIHQMSERIYGDGEERWIHNGTSVSDGTTSQQITNENGGSPSYRPQSSKQSNRKSNAISEQLTSQEIREIAQRYNNFGSALKPAHEPIVMARKPLSEKSIAENVLKHGTGGINIDGSRIEMKDKENINFERPRVREKKDWVYDLGIKWEDPNIKEYNESGRFPANIIFDEEAGQLLDEQSGKSKTKANKNYKHSKTDTESNTFTGRGTYTPREDEGGASRFFYCPKAAKKDRNEGLVVEQEKNKRPVGVAFNTEDDLFQQGNGNNHPTVKPTDLMRYLINLVTPPNGTILDPFMGSGSTGKAAVRCGVNFIGIEKEQEYMDIASARIEHERNKPTQQKLF